jgi:hypothetical protein
MNESAPSQDKTVHPKATRNPPPHPLRPDKGCAVKLWSMSGDTFQLIWEATSE